MFCWKPGRGMKSSAVGVVEISLRRYTRIRTSDGLDLRGADALASVVSDFRCKIRIRSQHREANATSFLSLLCLRANAGSELVLEAVGQEGAQTVGRIEHLIRRGFDIRARKGTHFMTRI
jgi:phosphotransferase system HPr (HPr) family protein